ncbi:hypothetical protein FGSG_13609 [Fusarium graminearum PH-1]|uniref:hypothetical protein n=1 Tax=Gibberella zeae (strain ATCC MYA-4620 / CBS 123657 / FGSC 9075 / NRRL 31084 / PH-1) TaxID=229533 RepID=UPI00021F1931|nr:hypothetical protein FGSG_13609 [Fusarium graminearum PH-1]ESU16166.1 hypothetical protein FGSG_13609 [Fusarium graminearum PH-1]|eukprot:XP_011328150.1 hypothetical protein FGSG_13609 [Fusarium graminearum PH-1]
MRGTYAALFNRLVPFLNEGLQADPSCMDHRSSKGVNSADLPTKISPHAIHPVVKMGVLVIDSALRNRALEFSRVKNWHETMSWVESTSNRLLPERDVLSDQCITPSMRPNRTTPLALAAQRKGKLFIPDNVGVIFGHELVDVATEKDSVRGFFSSEDDP